MLRERVGIFALFTMRVYIFIPVPRGGVGEGRKRVPRGREEREGRERERGVWGVALPYGREVFWVCSMK